MCNPSLFKQNNKTINIENVKSKFFYSYIFAKRKAHIPILELFWKNQLGNTSIDFPQCYFSRIKLLKEHKWGQFNFKQYHTILPSEQNLFQM